MAVAQKQVNKATVSRAVSWCLRWCGEVRSQGPQGRGAELCPYLWLPSTPHIRNGHRGLFFSYARVLTSLKLVLFLCLNGKYCQDRYINNVWHLQKDVYDFSKTKQYFFFLIVKQLSVLIQDGLFDFAPFNCVLSLLPDLRYLSLCGGLQEESEIKQVDSTLTTECRLKGYWSLV